MTRSEDIPDPTGRQIVRMFEDILAMLPAGCALLEHNETKGGFHVALVPADEHCAEFATLSGNDIYAVFFGRGRIFTTFECPWEIGLKRSTGLQEHLVIVRKMCLAVIAGNCEHQLRRFGIRGAIRVSETETYRVGDINVWDIFRPRRSVGVIQYASYYPGAENHSGSFPALSV